MNDSASRDSKPPRPRAEFPTTHWSVVLEAGAGSASQARAALTTLCTAYWYPLYAFVRRSGRPHHEAQDCTQEFLARLLASGGVAAARPERGRFRTFLHAALRNFLADEWRRTQTAKRGAGAEHVPLDLPPDAADRFTREPADTSLTPEQAFDRHWALGLIDQATVELRAEYEKSGRGALFATLAPLAFEDDAERSHAQHAATLGMNAHAFTVALARLRRRFSERLRARVAETVTAGTDVDAELRHLIAAVGR